MSTFCTLIELIFWGSLLIFAHSFLGAIFFKKSWAFRSWCAHNILICCHNPVSRTRTSSLLFADRCSLYAVRWVILADRFNARWPFAVLRCSLPANLNLMLPTFLAGRCWALASCWSFVTTHCPLHFKLLACRCPLIAVSYFGSRLFFSEGALAPGYLGPNPFSVHPSPQGIKSGFKKV